MKPINCGEPANYAEFMRHIEPTNRAEPTGGAEPTSCTEPTNCAETARRMESTNCAEPTSCAESTRCTKPASRMEPTNCAEPANWVYMVECRDGTLYTGWTADLAKRVAAHSTGRGAKYTRSRAPVRLVYAEQCADKSAALRREAAIKKLPRAQKLALAESWRAEGKT